MGMDYDEFEALLNGFKDLQKTHEKFIRNFITEMGMRTMAQTKAGTPVDTGALRNAWELSGVIRKGDELMIIIFNPMLYASHVEDGHRQKRRFVPGYWKNKRFVYTPYYGKGPMPKGTGPQGGGGGMMLKNRWVPGHHMARIAITKIERELPARYNRAFKKFLKGLNVGG